MSIPGAKSEYISWSYILLLVSAKLVRDALACTRTPACLSSYGKWCTAGGVFESQYLSGEQGSSKLDVTRADAHDSVLQSAAIQEATVQDAIKTARAGAARQTIQTEFPWDLTAQFEKVTVCDDTCPKAKNQVCNDGRGQAMEVSCAMLAPS